MSRFSSAVAAAVALALGLGTLVGAAPAASSGSSSSSQAASSGSASSSQSASSGSASSSETSSEAASAGSSSGAASSGTASSGSAANDAAVSNNPNQQEAQSSVWRISMGGRVLSNRGDRLWVALNNPSNMEVSEGDQAQPYIQLPISSSTTFVDASGSTVQASQVLAGQAVRVTFRYYWSTGGTPNTAIMVDCQQVALQGGLQRLGSYASVDDFARDVLVGTVATNSNGKLGVYVESGRVAYGAGENAVEYNTSGWYSIDTSGLSVYGTDGKTTNASALQPGDRVALYPESAEWAESYPPSYRAGIFKKVELLGAGEKLFTPDELQSTEWVTCTVQDVRTDSQDNEYNLTVFTLVPEAGSRLAKHKQLYTLRIADDPFFSPAVYAADGSKTTLSAVTSGKRVRVRYMGVAYDASPSRLDYCQHIEILA